MLYSDFVAKLANDIDNNRVLLNSRLLHGAMGAAGEAGEIADMVKKYLFQGHDLDNDKLVKECGDVLFYLQLILNQVGLSIQDAVDINIDKLLNRYPGGVFSSERSINRSG